MKRTIFSIIFLLSIALPLHAENTDNKVVVCYFHGNFRCWSCHTIEEYTKQAIEEKFKEELSSGKLELKIINYDKLENRHFIEDYQLHTKSVVFSLIKDDKEVKFVNLEKVWIFLRDKDKFFGYIQSNAQSYLGELE